MQNAPLLHTGDTEITVTQAKDEQIAVANGGGRGGRGGGGKVQQQQGRGGKGGKGLQQQQQQQQQRKPAQGKTFGRQGAGGKGTYSKAKIEYDQCTSTSLFTWVGKPKKPTHIPFANPQEEGGVQGTARRPAVCFRPVSEFHLAFATKGESENKS